MTVGPEGITEQLVIDQVTDSSQVSGVLTNVYKEPKASKVVRLQVIRGGAPLSVLDLVDLPDADLAKFKSVARTFNSLSAVLTQISTQTRSTALTHLLGKTLDIHHALNPSQVLLVCNVSSDPSEFKHSFAALKFTSRIRDCVKSMQREVSPGSVESDFFSVSPKTVSSPTKSVLPEDTPTPKRQLSVDTNLLETVQEMVPTTKAAQGWKENSKRHKSMQTSPVQLDEQAVQVSSPSRSGGSPEPLVQTLVEVGSYHIEGPHASQTPSVAAFPSNAEVIHIHRSMQTSDVSVKDTSTQQSPHLSLITGEDPIFIQGLSRHLASHSIQTAFVHTLETAVQCTAQTQNEGGNTSHLSDHSFGVQASIDSSSPDVALEELAKENEHLFNAHLQDQEDIQDLETELRNYHESAARLQLMLDQQRLEYEGCITMLQVQLREQDVRYEEVRLKQVSTSSQTEVGDSVEKLKRAVSDMLSVLVSLDMRRSQSPQLVKAGAYVNQESAQILVAIRAQQDLGSLADVSAIGLDKVKPSFENVVKELLEEVDRGRQDLDLSRKRHFDLANLCSALESEVNSQREHLASVTQELMETKVQLQQCKDNMREVELRNAQVQNEQTSQESMANTVHRLESEASALTYELSNLRKKQSTTQHELDTLRTDNESLSLKFRMLESLRSQEQEEASAQFTKMASEARRSNELAQRLQATLQENDSAILTFKTQIQDQKTLEEQVQTKDLLLAQVRSSLNVVSRERDVAMRDKENVASQLEIARVESQGGLQLKDRYNKMQQELTQERIKFKEVSLQLETAKKEKQEEKQARERTEEALMTDLQRKEEETSILLSQLNSLKQAVKDKAIALQEAQTNTISLREDVERTQSSLDRQGKQLSEALARAQEADEIINQLRAEVMALNSAVDTKEGDNEELKAKVSAVLTTLRETELEVTRERASVQRLQTDLRQVKPSSSEISNISKPLRLYPETKDVELAGLRKARDRLELENAQLKHTVERLTGTMQDLQTSRNINLESVFGQTLEMMRVRSEPMTEVRDKLKALEGQLSSMLMSSKQSQELESARSLYSEVQQDLDQLHLSDHKQMTGSRKSDGQLSRQTYKRGDQAEVWNTYQKTIAPQLQAILHMLQTQLGSEEALQRSVTEKLDHLKSSVSQGLASSSELFNYLQHSLPPAPDFQEVVASSTSMRPIDHQLCELQVLELKSTITALQSEKAGNQSQISALRASLAAKEAEYEKSCRSSSQKDLESHKLRKAIRAYEDIVLELRQSLQRAAAETQMVLEEKMQVMQELQALQKLHEGRIESPIISMHVKKSASLSDYLKQKDVQDSLLGLEGSRVKDAENNEELKHLQHFKEMWKESPFNVK